MVSSKTKKIISKNLGLGNLGSLPEKLAANYIANSNPKAKLNQKICDAISENPETIKAEGKQRFILITGAGASASISPEIPTAGDAADFIESKLLANKSFVNFKSEELRKLEQVYKQDPTEFETRMLAYSKFDRKVVMDQLRFLYDRRFIVGAFYEIVGHMLKHRFLDAIINFNFDELLDNCLREEIKDSAFQAIYSDGQCPRDFEDECLYSKRLSLKRPLYIKPHGTISHPSTLRFTREDYYHISEEMEALLKNLLQANAKNHQSYTLNLIIVGFGMKSFEFNRLLSESFLNKNGVKLNLHVFDTQRKTDYEKKLGDEFRRLSFSHPYNLCYYKISQKASLHKYFEKIWKQSEKLFAEDFRPKGINRHSLVSKIFSLANNHGQHTNSQNTAQSTSIIPTTKTYNGYKKIKDYFEHRIILEGVILILETDGIISRTMIFESRLGKYYRLYKKAFDNSGKTLHEILIKKLGLKPRHGFRVGAYTYDLGKGRKKINLAFDILKNHIDGSDSADNIDREEKAILYDLNKVSKDHRLALQHSHDFKYKLPSFNIPEEKQIMRTGLQWSYQYSQAMRHPWDLVLGILEKGNILLKGRFPSSPNLEFEIIHADYSKVVRGRKLNLLSNKILKLPWEKHVNHMIIGLKFDKTNSRVRSHIDKGFAFHFQSIDLSRDIIPVYYDGIDDINNIINQYVVSWFDAILAEGLFQSRIEENSQITTVSKRKHFNALRNTATIKTKDELNLLKMILFNP